MLNLVQLQERLKDVPMQALMQYANGANPQVPPFLALGELNRRKKMQEGAAAEQAKEMEGAPSIKDQIEQSAGLLALQGNRQRQAAQQQQAVQQAMPMAAPNTTTSEPAQMAGGGFVEDIVVPRDYQIGGQVKPQMNPEMLKRLMMLKAMKQKPGLSGLQTRPDMFRRADYAGGGIVAFNGEKGSEVSPIGKDPYDDNKSEFERDLENWVRAQKESMQERTPGMVGAYKKSLISPEQDETMRLRQMLEQKYGPKASMFQGYFSKMPQSERAEAQDIYKRIPGMSLAELRQLTGTTSVEDQAAKNQNLFADMLRGRAPIPQRSNDPALMQGRTPPALDKGIASITKDSGTTSAATPAVAPKRDLASLGVSTPADMTDEERLNKLRNLQRLAGVKENPFADIEGRYRKIEEEDMLRRKEQPMDQLVAFLGGIAGGRRGGTFGTQGAEGAMAAQKLSMEQAASNRKQDLDMAALNMSLAKEADARARGDAAEVRKEQDNQEKLKLDIAKLQSEDQYRRGMVSVHQRQADIQQERNLIDRAQADRTRQMAEISDFIGNFRSKNANNIKYLNKPDLLEQDAMAAAIRFFGPDRFKNLGLAPGISATPATPSGARPPITQFQR